MKRFPEDTSEGEPQILIPENGVEWLGIETDMPRRSIRKIIQLVLLVSAAAIWVLVARS